MLKSELLAALRTELHRHDFSHFVDEPPSITQRVRSMTLWIKSIEHSLSRLRA
jgi:hypothetical protein